jgi:uncharacterized protein YggU (UPF0235/DUF167 family)
MSRSTVAIHMEPNAKRNEVVGFATGYLLLRIAVKADDVNFEYGNEEIIAFLSEILGIQTNKISILQGKDQRVKLLGIDGMDAGQVRGKLRPHLKFQ